MRSLSFVLLCGLLAAGPLSAQSSVQTSPGQDSAPAQQTAPATPPLRFESLPPDPHTPTVTEEQQEQQQRMVAFASRLAAAEARWGAPMSSPGLSLAMQEASRSSTPAGTQIAYRLTATGFPPGESLTLLRWPLNGSPTRVMNGLAISATGVAICGAPAAATPGAATPAAVPACTATMKPGAPLLIRTTAAPGEAIRVALIGRDDKSGAASYAVPFPMQAEDGNCKVDLLLGLKNAELVLLDGHGFPANTTLGLEADSYGEKRQVNAKTDAQGHFLAALLPGIPGHESGEATLQYTGSGCAPALTFPWGKDSYRPK